MSQQVDNLFIDIFESEVHHAYTRMGAKLETLVRTGGSGAGKRVWFPKIGKKKTTKKGRHAKVQVQDRGETGVWCDIEDDYTEADMIDELDQLKTNVALRQAYSTDHAYALGREADQKIINAMATSSNVTTDVGVVTLAKINEVFTYFGENAVPVDDRRYLCTSAKGWTDLMAIPQFCNADYVPESELPFRGGSSTAKRWFTFLCFIQEGGVDDDGNPDAGALPKSGDTRQTIAWHWKGVGYHKQSGPNSKWDWENMYQAWSGISSQACGACLIDETATYLIEHDETAVPA